jgi:hypothetical protein
MAIACTPRQAKPEMLRQAVQETLQRRGKLLIPAFAVGRIQGGLSPSQLWGSGTVAPYRRICG